MCLYRTVGMTVIVTVSGAASKIWTISFCCEQKWSCTYTCVEITCNKIRHKHKLVSWRLRNNWLTHSCCYVPLIRRRSVRRLPAGGGRWARRSWPPTSPWRSPWSRSPWRRSPRDQCCLSAGWLCARMVCELRESANITHLREECTKLFAKWSQM